MEDKEQKFDLSCGLSIKEIEMAKFLIKQNINAVLPQMPDIIEEILFDRGSKA